MNDCGGPKKIYNSIQEEKYETTSDELEFIVPVASFNVAGTLDGANIIGNEPAKPFVMPNAAVKMNAGVSPLMVG